MLRKALWLFGMLAFAGSFTAQASLIGATLIYTNPDSNLSGTFVVGPGIEKSFCYYSLEDGPCLIGVELDWGAEENIGRAFNFTDTDLIVGSVGVPSTVTSQFIKPGLQITGAEIVSNTWPFDPVLTFADNIVKQVVTGQWKWAANSEYFEVVRITSVPEPGTLSLLAAGLLGLFARRSKRAV